MDNIYDILKRFNAASRPLMESRSSKPDFLDLDKDGNRTEPMKAAAKEVDEASYSAKAARAGKDIGKPGKNFEKIAKSAGERYGSKAAGERVAGAVLAKLRAKESVAEDDMEEGNDFTGARMAAIKAGKPTFRVDGRTYRVTGDTSDERVMEKKEKILFPGTPEYEKRFPKELRTGERAKSSTGGTIEKTATGIKHTARYDDDTDADDDSKSAQADKYASPKKKGRPKGSKRALGAKGPTGKSKLLQKGSIKEADRDEYDEEGPEDLMAAVDEELNAPGKHIDNLVDVLNATFDTMYSPEFERPRAMIQRYIELVTNTDVDHYDDEEDPNHEDEPMIRRMQHGNIARHIREYDLGDYLAAAYHELHKLAGSNKTAGDLEEDYDRDEYDEEGEMAKSQARTIEDAAQELQDILDDDENLPEWVQKKITLAKEYIDSARDYMKANPDEEDMDVDVEMDDEEIMTEKAVSRAQRAAAGIARAAQKGAIPKSELRGASKEMAKMPAGELKKFAKTKEKGLPEKVKEEDKEEVDETTVAGSVATSDATPKAKKGGMQFGKGVYESQIAESFDRQLTMLTEGMNINMSMDAEGSKSLSVTATDDDAVKLAQILRLAGMESSDHDDACPTCGAGRGMCEHEMVEEADLANSADDTVYADTNYMTQTLSGGLNGPKLQVNPNNPADNPLSMRKLGQHSSSSLNLGSEADKLKEETNRRLMDLYQQVKIK